jgi:hypothetical protein
MAGGQAAHFDTKTGGDVRLTRQSVNTGAVLGRAQPHPDAHTLEAYVFIGGIVDPCDPCLAQMASQRGARCAQQRTREPDPSVEQHRPGHTGIAAPPALATSFAGLAHGQSLGLVVARVAEQHEVCADFVGDAGQQLVARLARTRDQSAAVTLTGLPARDAVFNAQLLAEGADLLRLFGRFRPQAVIDGDGDQAGAVMLRCEGGAGQIEQSQRIAST